MALYNGNRADPFPERKIVINFAIILKSISKVLLNFNNKNNFKVRWCDYLSSKECVGKSDLEGSGCFLAISMRHGGEFLTIKI